jgi:Uma2 family endonuclease
MSTSAPIRRRRFTVDEYLRMGEAGVFHEDDRIELLQGEVVEMTPVGKQHAAVVSRLNNLLAPAVVGRAIVRVQDPVVVAPTSVPEPDIAVVRFRSDFYSSGHPAARDVLLVVEVSDTSIVDDMGLKARLYAEAGIAEYWVVDIARRRLLVHTDPGGGGYQSVKHFREPEAVTPIAVPSGACAVAEILGSADPTEGDFD